MLSIGTTLLGLVTGPLGKYLAMAGAALAALVAGLWWHAGQVANHDRLALAAWNALQVAAVDQAKAEWAKQTDAAVNAAIADTAAKSAKTLTLTTRISHETPSDACVDAPVVRDLVDGLYGPAAPDASAGVSARPVQPVDVPSPP